MNQLIGARLIRIGLNNSPLDNNDRSLYNIFREENTMTNAEARKLLGLEAEEYASTILGIAYSMYYENAKAPQAVVEVFIK